MYCRVRVLSVTTCLPLGRVRSRGVSVVYWSAMKGAMVALTPPLPKARRVSERARPASWVVCEVMGREVVKRTRQPRRFRLVGLGLLVMGGGEGGGGTSSLLSTPCVGLAVRRR